MTSFQTTNPATGRTEFSLATHSKDEVRAKLALLSDAQITWAKRSFDDRAKLIYRIADQLERRADELAGLMAKEMGKPLAEGRAEANKCALVCRYYADNAESFLRTRAVSSDASDSGVRCDPLGTILAIMPWNFPFWQLFRFGAPALMAGNAIAMKHAPNVPQCADAIEKIVLEAGLPKGLLVNLRISHDEIPSLIGNELISAVTFTGSTRAGRIIAALSGKHLKKCVLELGGSDPFIVLADADIGQAARIGAASRLLNAGQSCIAAKRFIVERAVADDFLDALITELKAAVIGDPMDPKTTVGPLARQDLRDALHDQVLRSVQQGSNCLIGGDLLQRAGWYYPVTLLTEVKSGTAAWEEELFGPVAVVRVVENADEALAAANDSPYGLGAAVFTRDLDRIKAWSADLHAGAVFFNGMVKSDPRLPFGGVKRSGYGRELGKLGILEFVNQKTVWIA